MKGFGEKEGEVGEGRPGPNCKWSSRQVSPAAEDEETHKRHFLKHETASKELGLLKKRGAATGKGSWQTQSQAKPKARNRETGRETKRESEQ